VVCAVNTNCGDVLLQILIYGISNGAVLALNAISITVIYGTVRTLNLAHGDVFALTTVLITTVVRALGLQPDSSALVLIGGLAITLGVGILFGTGLSVAIERIAFKPFRGRSRLAPLIATLGISFMLFQVSMIWRVLMPSWVWHEHRSVPGLNEVPTDGIPNLLPNVNLVRALGLNSTVNFNFSNLFILVIAIACAIGASLYLKRSKTGHAIRAASQNPQLAQINGVNLNSAIRRAFAFGGALAGVAAFIFAMYYARPFGAAGAESGLMAFAAAILGGVGSPIGALVASMGLGIFSSFSDYFLSAQWTPVLLLIIFIAVLFWRPTGLAAEESNEDAASQTIRDSVILIAPGKQRSNRWLIAIFVGLALFPIISLLTGLGWQSLVRNVSIYVLIALGLNILLGVAGILDLGFAVSFGIGGYTVALLANPYGLIGSHIPQPIDFTILILISAVLAGLYGAFKGGLARRLHSDYLAVVTLALGLLAERVINNLRDLTGGIGGMGALPPPRILSVPIEGQTQQYYFVFVFVLIVALFAQRLIRSRTGRAWIAASDDETAAASIGINIDRYKTLALIVSSAIAGVAGALYASTFAFVSPDMVAFHVSALALAMVILGGAGSVPGAVLGAMLIIGYDQIIIPQFAAFVSQFWPSNSFIGSVPDLRGTSFFNFGLALYLTVWLRARRRGEENDSQTKPPSRRWFRFRLSKAIISTAPATQPE
jgi:branched-chain amino acid transport system permease protein